MSISDNPHAMRLYDSLLKYTDEQTAQNIAHKIPLSKSADINKKFLWAENICNELHNEFDDETIKKIRMNCACGPETGKMSKMNELYHSSDNLDDFADKANKLNQGFTLEHKDNVLFLIYPTCYCSCVKHIDKKMSKIWCYCTLGYTKKMFEHILERCVDVELLESVKTGANRCVIKII